MLANGSDEALNFAFLAYGERGVAFPDITYGFYRVFADLYNLAATEVPLTADFSVNLDDYAALPQTVFLANPNAPTGRVLPPARIRALLESNPERVVVIDEAYIDFGGQSCVPLIREYDNLLVTGTFSKSRSMAGARLGFAFGCPALIADLETLRFSNNSYNINRLTMAAGLGQLADEETTRQNCRTIIENRENTTRRLTVLGFSVIPSAANFVLAAHPAIAGKTLYERLKKKGVLVRHFDTPRLKNYNRITIGSSEQMDALLTAITAILEE